jgi:hypothetical protein
MQERIPKFGNLFLAIDDREGAFDRRIKVAGRILEYKTDAFLDAFFVDDMRAAIGNKPDRALAATTMRRHWFGLDAVLVAAGEHTDALTFDTIPNGIAGHLAINHPALPWRKIRSGQRDRDGFVPSKALLVATACASPPQGRAHWTLELLADAMVKLTEHDSLSPETVRRRLAENGLKPWRRDMWCIPHVDGEYVARMEDVLDLYAEAPDRKWPVVCFDESPVQLIGEMRQPIPAEPGQLERYDYEYRRNGTVNLFVVPDVHRPWRKVKVTERRAAEDYAQCMRELVDVHYPDAEYIRVVQDNLSTHSAGALYQAFPPAEARRILRRLEFHYTPKHASWLNMVAIEIGVLRGQCPDRRIDDPKILIREIAAWERQRNEAGARIKWMVTADKARVKMGRAYPDTTKEP